MTKGPESGERVTVLYLGGVTRSGSTLVDRALGHLPGFVSTGELGLITTHGIVDNRLCGCSLRFRDCVYWRAVGEKAYGGWDGENAARLVALHPQVTRQRHLPMLASGVAPHGFVSLLAEYGELVGRLYAAISAVSGARVVVDSTKAPAYAALLRRVPSLDVRIAHLVRDSRATAYSAGKRQVHKDSPDKVVEKHRYRPATITARWTLYHLVFAGMAALGEPQLVLRYEDFTRDPGASLMRIAEFAGLPVADVPFAEGRTLRLGPTHTMAGNDAKFDTGPVVVREDDAWRTQLPTGSVWLVNAMSWPLLKGFGYRIAPDPGGARIGAPAPRPH